MYRQRSNRNVLMKIIESDNLSPIKRQRQSGDELIYSPISKIVQDLRNSSLSPSDDECKLYAESTARDLDLHDYDESRYYNVNSSKL
ncbi:hypothetical protein PV328_011481, partial [Microctonus aethiopoides]